MHARRERERERGAFATNSARLKGARQHKSADMWIEYKIAGTGNNIFASMQGQT
jgi:hypothetical protein